MDNGFLLLGVCSRLEYDEILPLEPFNIELKGLYGAEPVSRCLCRVENDSAIWEKNNRRDKVFPVALEHVQCKLNTILELDIEQHPAYDMWMPKAAI